MPNWGYCLRIKDFYLAGFIMVYLRMKKELETAKYAAAEAGKEILKFYKSSYDITEKSYHNPVTDADNAADALIKKIIMGEFPDYGWLSEETIDSADRLEKEYVWIIDPLDGTKEFIEGVDNFVVSIALTRNSEPILGVLYNPPTGELFTAVKGEGAFYNGRQVHCSKNENLGEGSIVISRSETRRGLWDNTEHWYKERAHIGSVAYKLGLTAAGKYDCFATLRPKNEWDVAAGHVILSEAGGMLVNIEDGKHRDFNRKDPLITPGLVGGNVSLVQEITRLWNNMVN